ncbi:MAG TPA: threonine/serine exporter family protein [Nannocystaceae bacterium]|nr:threonine/serine exporter family protein [Nannocystaceae bacterium]
MAEDADPPTTLLLALARGLHTAGFPAPTLEGALGRVATHLGVVAQFFSSPTSLFAAFGAGRDQHVYLLRVEPASVDLGRLAELDALIEALVSERITLERAIVLADEIGRGKPPYNRPVTIGAYALSSGASALFLGGGVREVIASSAIGLVTGALALIGRRIAAIERLFELLAAGLAAFLAVACAQLFGPLGVFTTTLAGLIILLPGFTLTIALTELATRHLASGTARLAGALVTFLTIGFGVALGSRLAEQALGSVVPGVIGESAPGAELLALFVAPVALAIVLRAPLSELPWLVASGIVGFYGGRWGTRWLSPELGMFVGALALGATSNLYASLRHKPTTTTLVPGILLLVPGGIGYAAVSEMISREVVPGIETAFEMILIAVSLVAGLLAANVLTPPRGSKRAGT